MIDHFGLPVSDRARGRAFYAGVRLRSGSGWRAFEHGAGVLIAVERVRSAGGEVRTITTYGSGREAVCVDDQGTTFRLSEPAPGYDPDD